MTSAPCSSLGSLLRASKTAPQLLIISLQFKDFEVQQRRPTLSYTFSPFALQGLPIAVRERHSNSDGSRWATCSDMRPILHLHHVTASSNSDFNGGQEVKILISFALDFCLLGGQGNGRSYYDVRLEEVCIELNCTPACNEKNYLAVFVEIFILYKRTV